MTKHLGYSILGGLLFLSSTVVTVWFFEKGIHEGMSEIIANSSIVQSSMRASFWIGVLTGGISSVVLRKSLNHRTYVWIIIIFTLVLTEMVIATLL